LLIYQINIVYNCCGAAAVLCTTVTAGQSVIV